MFRDLRWLVIVTGLSLLLVVPARGYVDMAPTLARIIREANTISIVEVDRFSPEKGVILLKKVRDLKGETANDLIKHHVSRAGEAVVERPILEWAEPGRRGVMFVTGKTVLVCVGEFWYQAVASQDGWWHLHVSRPDLPLAYFGTVSRLIEAIPLILAGKSAVITTLTHGAEREGASFDLALNRASLPGLVRVQRLRADLRMPPMALGVGANPAYVVGPGRAGHDEIPILRKRLGAADATTRAESATDLGSLGTDAVDAISDLTNLLDDAAPTVRMAAAAALLRVKPEDMRPLKALTNGLASEDTVSRRHAARYAGLTGSAAAPLASKLGVLLGDPDPLVRRTALQAIATIGPAAACTVEGVTALLSKPDSMIDAADALGRIGPAARPALKTLAKMLDADSVTVRWAAVRAMAQVGGDGAAPAVKFMIRELPNASDVDGYNILIYLALLGPVAKDALPAVRKSHVRNPVLRQTTAWAIDPGSELPWLGPMGESDVASLILQSYVQELGDHLKPVSHALAEKIINGNAGSIPSWGYKLLSRYPEPSVAVLTVGLEDKNLVKRERAAVALGYMGRTAGPAKPRVAEALKAATDEKEALLLKWCLREIKGGRE